MAWGKMGGSDKGLVVWLMGPTSSGKTTLAGALAGRLRCCGIPVLHFDGDEVRDFFGPMHGFSDDDRLRVVRTLVHLAAKASAAGIAVVVSALTASEAARAHVRRTLPRLMVGYLRCPVETCARRDPKGLYARAARGEIQTLIGFNSPYYPPGRADIVLDTDGCTLNQCLKSLEAAVLGRIGSTVRAPLDSCIRERLAHAR